MTFDKHYPNRKDRRKQYYNSGKHDRTCRPNGSCAYCRDNRLHRQKRQEPIDVTNNRDTADHIADKAD